MTTRLRPLPCPKGSGGAQSPLSPSPAQAVAGQWTVWLARALPCLRPFRKDRLPPCISVCFPRLASSAPFTSNRGRMKQGEGGHVVGPVPVFFALGLWTGFFFLDCPSIFILCAYYFYLFRVICFFCIVFLRIQASAWSLTPSYPSGTGPKTENQRKTQKRQRLTEVNLAG